MSYKPDTTQVLYLTDANAEIINYKRCVVAPISGSEITISASCITGGGNTLIKTWITDAIGLYTLASGNWNFNLYASVDDISGITKIYVDVFKSDIENVETELFNFSTNDINDLTANLQLGTYNPGVISLSPTDRLVIKLYVYTDSAFARTVTLYYLGSSHQSRIVFPFDITVIGDMQKVIYNPSGNGLIGGSSGSGGLYTSGSVTDGHLVIYYGTTGSLVKDGGPIPTGGGGFTQGCMFTMAEEVTLPSTVDVSIAWDTIGYDNDSMYNSGSPTLININTSGIYLICTQFIFANGGDDYTIQMIQHSIGGDTVISQDGNKSSNSAAMRPFVAGDTLEVTIRDDSEDGSIIQNSHSPFISIQRIG